MKSQTSNMVGGILILLILSAYVWATWQFFTKPLPGGNDFRAPYSSWEAYVKYGMDPYSDAAGLYTQKAIYGRAALPTEDQNFLTYPFYAILLHAPFLFIEYPLARAIYMTLLQVMVLTGVIISLNLARWRVSAGMLAVVCLWSLLNYYEARAVIIGQIAIFGFLSLSGTLLLLRQKRDAAAGALFVLATVKPSLVLLIAPFLLLWALARRRWQFVTGFFGTLAVLVAGSLFFLPTWIGDMLYRVLHFPEYNVNQNPIFLLTHVAIPGLGTPVEILLNGTLIVGMLWSWWRVLRENREQEFYWALGATLIVSNLVMPRVATTNYVLMLVPMLWLFGALDRVPRWGRPALLVILAVSLIGLWWLHVVTAVGNWEQPIMYVPGPVALGLAWVACRAWLIRDAVRMQIFA
jgi:hypothetical protein